MRIVRGVERRSVSRFLTLAKEAELENLHATARSVRERVLQLDADQRLARHLLGYTRAHGKWIRPVEVGRAIAMREDEDYVKSAEYREHLRRLEEERLKEIVRVCRKYGTLAEKRRVLLPLLAKMPRRADMHEALGHEKIGEDYVRPELVAFVRALPDRLAAWRAWTPAAPVEKSDFVMDVPGLQQPPPFYNVGGREVGSALGAAPAVAVARTQALLGRLLQSKSWDVSPILFLGADPYQQMVRALHKDNRAFKLYVKYDNYEHKDFYAIRASSAADAAERYAHGAGYMTMFESAAPKGSLDTHAWLLEGFGFLVAFELFDRGYISYVSIYEFSGKRTNTRPPPATKTRAECLRWMREQMLKGYDYRLHEICAMKLNSLDLCASMQAYSFLRFLFLYDPGAARRFPAALKKLEEGPQVERTRRALRETFGKSLAELETLWRAFVLEIGAATSG